MVRTLRWQELEVVGHIVAAVKKRLAGAPSVQEAWACWRRHVTEEALEVSKAHAIPR